MDHNSACAYLRDEAGRCVYANEIARREFGIGPDEAENTTQQNGSRSTRFREQDRQVLDSGQAMEFVDSGPAHERYWLTSKFPFVDQSGRRFVGGISFEITDRLQPEQILRKTESLAAAGQMASLLAHEINNPLAALTNIFFLLQQQHLDPSSRDLLSAGTDALTRIDRIAAMTMEFFFEKDTAASISLRDLIEDVAETLTSADRFNSIHLTREFECDGNVVASPLGSGR
jgi:signal transduction histidine kinase